VSRSNVRISPGSGVERVALAAIFHFGKDECQRVSVLRQVGYKVRKSDSLDRLRLHLVRNKNVDAVIVSDPEPHCAEQAADLVRQHSGAPLILFRGSDIALDESLFDRVFSSQVPPAKWLFDTAVVVMQCKELRAQSEELRRESEASRAWSSRLQRKFQAESEHRVPRAWPATDSNDLIG